jgi:hypothetical protein
MRILKTKESKDYQNFAKKVDYFLMGFSTMQSPGMQPGESGDLGTDNRGEQGLERVRLPRLERLDLSRIITIIALHACVSINPI